MRQKRRLIKTVGDLKMALDDLCCPDDLPIKAWVDDIDILQDINFAYLAIEDDDSGEFSLDVEYKHSDQNDVVIISVGN